ncbi:MAG: metallophosphoesterase [Holophagales bacterium]|nr:metallophosphoesterase [Holophagales bacterium]
MPVRVLFLSDTHLGLDLPTRPRVDRRRRGDDLFESFERALAPAVSGEAGIVVHGGDLFYRSRIPAWLAERVFSRLAQLADLGLDLFWIPGNHERSGVPRGLLLTHPRIRVFDRPRTFVVRRDGLDLALSVSVAWRGAFDRSGHGDPATDEAAGPTTRRPGTVSFSAAPWSRGPRRGGRR